MRRKKIPTEALVDLQRRLGMFPARSHERRSVIQQSADLYGVSEATLYRALRTTGFPKSLRRSDRGVPRVIPKDTLERYCEIIAALKVKTTNRKGRCLPTTEAVRLLSEYGVETPDGFVKTPPKLLNPTTVNRYLREWGIDRHTLNRESPAARFQATTVTTVGNST
jgi:hypothetical protein